MLHFIPYIFHGIFSFQPYQNRKVIAWIEKIFRGHRFPTLIETYASTYKPDFQLIPKDEEEIWYKRLAECKHRTKLIHPTVPLPPLLKVFANYYKCISL